MVVDQNVFIKWILNPCHLGNTSMPDEELALLACPRGDGEWAMAFKNKKTRSIVQACFSQEQIRSEGVVGENRETLFVELSEYGEMRDCDPQVFTDRLRENEVDFMAVNVPEWMRLIKV